MDVQRFSELVADIYDATLDPPLWGEILKGVCDFVPGVSASLFWQDDAKKTGQTCFAYGSNQHFEQLYWDKYLSLNPFAALAASFPVGELYSGGDILPRAEFTETAFYKEWMAPQGWGDVLSVNLDKAGTSRAVFWVARHARDGEVDDEMRRRMRLLAPHVRRAAKLGKLINHRRIEAAALSDTLNGLNAGVFLVDAKGRLVHTNASARDMLGEGNVLRANGRPVTVDEQADRTLQAVFAAPKCGVAHGAGDITIELIPRNGERFVTQVLPLTAGKPHQVRECNAAVAAVFVQRTGKDAPVSLEALERKYQLTPGELRVMAALMDIGGVSEVAYVLKLSPTTVRTHLRHVFEKTGVRRQSDLVKLVRSHSVPILTRTDDHAA